MSDTIDIMSDMSESVTVRRLQRETSALLRLIEESGQALVVTRDGMEVAVLAPLSPVEKAWRQYMREAGHDPDDPRWIHGDPEAWMEAGDGGPSLSEVLAAQREHER